MLLFPFNNLYKKLNLEGLVESLQKSLLRYLPFESKLLELVPHFCSLSWKGLVSSFVLAWTPLLYHLIVMAPYFNYWEPQDHSIYWYGWPPYFEPLQFFVPQAEMAGQ